jgi:hypothetical protein
MRSSTDTCTRNSNTGAGSRASSDCRKYCAMSAWRPDMEATAAERSGARSMAAEASCKPDRPAFGCFVQARALVQSDARPETALQDFRAFLQAQAQFVGAQRGEVAARGNLGGGDRERAPGTTSTCRLAARCATGSRAGGGWRRAGARRRRA